MTCPPATLALALSLSQALRLASCPPATLALALSLSQALLLALAFLSQVLGPSLEA